MAIRKILTIDKPEDLEFLRKQSRPVEVFDDRLHMLIDDMLDTVKKANGAGLSAVQVGVLKRVFVAFNENEEFEVFVNPKIIESSGSCPILEEGCLSVPKYYGVVKRPNIVVVQAQDRFGNTFTKQFTGFSAKAICHENDHLDGVLFIDKVVDEPKKGGKKKKWK